MKLQEELTLTVPTEMGTNNTGLATKVLADIQKVLACALVHSTEGRVTQEKVTGIKTIVSVPHAGGTRCTLLLRTNSTFRIELKGVAKIVC